jgi:rsbT antagonist protein RsbS
VTGEAPIVNIGDALVVSFRGDFADTDVLRIEDEITQTVARTGTHATLIDVSGLAIVDSFIAGVIARIAGMIRLLGSDVAVVGIQPAVAITLIELGVQLRGIDTALDASLGMALLRRRGRT